MGFSRIEDSRAWQTTYGFKPAIYELSRTTPIEGDFQLRDQLCAAVASAVSQIEEGHARFYPKDNARFVVGAKASLAEARGHLRDAADKGHISLEVRMTHDRLAEDALREIVGLIDYLQSPEAEENARRIKAKRAARRAERLKEHRTKNPEPGTRNPNMNKNSEPGTRNVERSGSEASMPRIRRCGIGVGSPPEPDERSTDDEAGQ